MNKIKKWKTYKPRFTLLRYARLLSGSFGPKLKNANDRDKVKHLSQFATTGNEKDSRRSVG